MRTRITAWATNSLLVFDGISASPSSDLHDTGLIMVIPPESVFIVTGINMGPTIVDVEPLEARPPEPADTWEDVAEFTARRNPGVSITVHGEMELPSADAPSLAPDDVAYVRIRVSATGRDLQNDLAVSEPSEHYLVQVWPTSDPNEPIRWNGASHSTENRRAAKRLSGDGGAAAG